jgi:hypothetical protein
MTQAQLDANRANAQLSTGPCTDAGKARSSRNAISHGLRSGDVVLAHENADAFNTTLDCYKERFAGNDLDLTHLVEQLVAAQWRLARVQRLQRLYLDTEILGIPENNTNEPTPDQLILNHMKDRGHDVLVTLHRYEIHFDRTSWRVRRELEKASERSRAYRGPQFDAMLSAIGAPPSTQGNKQITQSKPEQPPQQPATPQNPFTKTAESMSDLSLREMIDDLKKMQRTNPSLKQAKDDYERELIAMGPIKRAQFLNACLAAQSKPKAKAA